MDGRDVQGLRDHVATASVEDAPFKADVNDLRFNFTPSFTRVGNQFVVASTVELCRDLVDELQKEAKAPAGRRPRVAADSGSFPAAWPTS